MKSDDNKQNNLFTPFGVKQVTKEEEDDFLLNFKKAAEILFGDSEENTLEKSTNQKNPQ